MQQKTLLGIGAIAGLALIVGGGVAFAQAGDPAPAPAPAAAGELQQPVQLSPQAQLAQAQSIVDRMDGARSSVRRMLAEARAEQDVVKTLCLDDKLNQLDVAIRSAGERKDALELAVDQNDADLANHEFTILSVLQQRSDQLSAEANECIGREAGIFEDSSVETTIDPDIPEDEVPPVYEVITEPPSCTSCFN